MPAISALSPMDLAVTRTPAAPTTMRSPDHPGRVRVPGMQSRYRNDPYGCAVLPPLQNVTNVVPAQASNQGARLPTIPLPPAFQMASRTASRVKTEIARAASFTMSEEIAEEPTAEVPSTAAPGWALVRLKHEVLMYRAPFPVSVGDYVVLEGDRGENIGCIHQLEHNPPAHSIRCSIVRFATDDDLELLKAQRQREDGAMNFAQGVADALQLNIRIVDTEFQTDGNKLTVFFCSRRVIDFRQLQRQLFKQYRCRIWLVNWVDVVKPSS